MESIGTFLILAFLIGIWLGIMAGAPSCYYYFRLLTKQFSWGGKYGVEKLILLNSVGVGFSNIFFSFLINDKAGRELFEQYLWIGPINGIFYYDYSLYSFSFIEFRG